MALLNPRCSPRLTLSSHTMTPTTSGSSGTSYMTSVSSFSISVRSPRAPVPRFSAARATARNAPSVNSRDTPCMAMRRWYCRPTALCGPISTCTSSSSPRELSGTVMGKRPTNSGIRPYVTMSVLSTSISAASDSARRASDPSSSATLPSEDVDVALLNPIFAAFSFTALFGSCSLTMAPNPMEPTPASSLAEMCWSRPENAPPQMKRMSVVSTCTNSPRGFLRPPFSGTLTTVPSTILSSACCTPSPDTSRVMDTFSDLRLSLSISSMYTMPR
mmetsp:Transcript_34983/g.85731  ORF Transcript_34983/g.85731 Transcript_34983/m.85731 type:complete len:274 (-) Transcript_34983:434-1255(-)